MGPLTGGGGGSQCRLSILRNGNVACLCRLFMPMSHIKFKKCQWRMSLSISVSCRMSPILMSHVDFKKGPCRRVEFRYSPEPGAAAETPSVCIWHHQWSGGVVVSGALC